MKSVLRILAVMFAASFNMPAVAGSIAGTVTDSETGLGINAAVSIYDSEGTFLDFVFTNNEGQFLTEGAGAIADLESGNYFAKTFNFIGYFNRLYDGIGCTELNCSITSGTPILVTQGQATVGIDFALDSGGGLIRGRVTDNQGSALPGTQTVLIYDEAGIAYTRTFDAGQGYVVSEGLPAGIYYAGAFTASDVAPEFFGGRPCINSICQPDLTDPITVIAGQTVTNVNFSLNSGGSISGTVVDEDNGNQPIVVGVSIYDTAFDDDGAFGYVGTAISDGTDGSYTLLNVPPGDYYISTGSFGGFDREIFDDVACEGACDPSTGVLITVAGDEAITDIDFALGSGGHIVTGRVTDGSGDGIGGVRIDVFDSGGNYIAMGRTSGFGSYGITAGLADGTYYLKAVDEFARFTPELSGDIPCESECDPTTGQALVLSGDGGTSEVVDFELARDRILRGVFEY